MKEIYWITVLGNLNTVVMMILILLLILGIFAIMVYSFNDDISWDKHCSKFFKEYCLITGIVCAMACFMPSKQDLLAIYGIGGTIDYIQGNDKAKELPDKVVTALTEYLENVKKDKDEDR